MLELRRRTGFAQQQLDVGPFEDLPPRQLHGDEAVELWVLGHPDVAEVAASQQFDELESPDRPGRRFTKGGRIDVEQIEIAAGCRTGERFDRSLGDNLDAVVAMRTIDVHGKARCGCEESAKYDTVPTVLGQTWRDFVTLRAPATRAWVERTAGRPFQAG